MFRPFHAAVAAALLVSASASASQMNDAYQTAAAQVGPGATLIKARQEAPATYGFYFLKNRRVVEIEISMVERKPRVLKVSTSGTDKVSDDVIVIIAKHAADKVKLPEGRLMEIAADSLKDTPELEVTLEAEAGKLVMVVGKDRINALTGNKIGGKK